CNTGWEYACNGYVAVLAFLVPLMWCT
ncbi:hypothetical protein A2U01_0061111, partial [Trifolium medium]|nr:hypothetical protein [Trifolium medium]